MSSKRPIIIDDYYEVSKRSKIPKSDWWHEHEHHPWMHRFTGYGDKKVSKSEGRYYSRPKWDTPAVSFSKPKLQKPRLNKLPYEIRKHIRSFLPDVLDDPDDFERDQDYKNLAEERRYGKMRGMPNELSYEDYIDWRKDPIDHFSSWPFLDDDEYYFHG